MSAKAFRVEGHAHEVEVRIETVDLDRILDVVSRRTVAVVVGIISGCRVLSWPCVFGRCPLPAPEVVHRMSLPSLHAVRGSGPAGFSCSAARALPTAVRGSGAGGL